MNLKDLDQQYTAATYARFPVTLVSGKGSILTDDQGKDYIDLGSGIAVNTFGASDDAWAAAIAEQLGKLQHTSNLFYTEPYIRLAEQLCLRSGMKKVFFSNSGAEANECAIKVAREYAETTKGPGHHTIVTLKDSFHGRTLTTLAATGQEVFHHQFQPLTPGFVHAEANNVADLEAKVAENNCAAIFVELIQGEGGVNPLTGEFIAVITRIAKENDLLIMVDEIQTGNGRTGKLFAYQNFDLMPDVVTTAKGLAGGLPIGVTMMGERTKDVLRPGMNGSTFGGNLICCAAALNVLSRIDEPLLAEVREKGSWIRAQLENAPGVKNVTGMGLMIGVEPERPVGEVIAACRDNGVLVLSAKSKVRLLPPLNIPWDLLEKAVAGLKEALKG